MKSLLRNNSYLLFLIAVFIICELLAGSLGNFPLNDDWSYAKSVKILLSEGRIDIGEWPAMTLLTHLLWGGLFTNVFGFSFAVLRLSTLVAALGGIVLLFAIVHRTSRSARTGFFAAACLLLNPLHFNLSNTFMTDVSFNTLLLAFICVSVKFFERPSVMLFLPLAFLSVCLVLLRQYGLIVPAAFSLSCLLIREQKIRWFLLSIAVTALTFLALRVYENYLREMLPATAAYKFTGGLGLKSMLGTANYFFGLRWKTFLLQLLLYSLPLTLTLIVQFGSGVRRPVLVSVLIASAAIAVFLFEGVQPLPGNVLVNMSLGTETFYESLGEAPASEFHTYSVAFAQIMEVLKYISAAAGLTAVFLFVALSIQQRRLPKPGPLMFLLIMLLLLYTAALMVTESYFDRYHLPAITLVLVMTGSILRAQGRLVAAALPLFLFAYVAVAGTRDYMRMNEVKWQAYDYLIKENGAHPYEINAGFEINSWNNGGPGWWSNIFTTKDFRYLIQYRQEDGFRAVKEFPFKRFFPPATDTLRIFGRTTEPR